MSASAAVEGYGSVFSTSPTDVTYTAAGEVSKISGPGIEGKWVDVSHLSSPSGWQEFIASLVDAGEIKLEMNFVKAQYALALAWFRTTSVQYFKIVFSQGSMFKFQGGLKSLGTETPKDDKISNTLTFKITGLPVFTP